MELLWRLYTGLPHQQVNSGLLVLQRFPTLVVRHIRQVLTSRQVQPTGCRCLCLLSVVTSGNGYANYYLNGAGSVRPYRSWFHVS